MKYLQKLIYTLSLSLLCLTLGAQNFQQQATSSAQFRAHLEKRTVADNSASLRFIKVETGQYFVPDSFQIIEKSKAQLFSNITKDDNSSANSSSRSTLNSQINYTVHSGIVKFQVREHCDYIIKVNDRCCRESENCINWLELVQNKEVIINLYEQTDLSLSGIIRSDVKNFQKQKVIITCRDVNSGETFTSNPDREGKFSLKCKYGRHYLIQFRAAGSNELSFGLQLTELLQEFKPVTLKSNNFKILLKAETEPMSVTRTGQFPIISGDAENFLPGSNEKFTYGKTLRLSNYRFDYDAHILTDDCKKELDSLADILRSKPNLGIAIKVYTDTRGNHNFNKRLTDEIAGKMVSYISSKGIQKSRLQALGMGSSNPVNVCNENAYCTEMQHLANRRAEIQILSTSNP